MFVFKRYSEEVTTMQGKPLSHEIKKENGFKKPDRVDRHPRENPEPTNKPANNHAPDPNDETHRPKIVPWK